jgi:anti-anti-sigma factor
MSLLQISHVNGKIPVTVFQLLERITLDNFAELEKNTKNESEKGMRRLVIDLSQTPALSSIGVRGIVVIHKMVTALNGNSFKLAGARPPVRDVLEIAGITHFIGLYETVEEALASYG